MFCLLEKLIFLGFLLATLMDFLTYLSSCIFLATIFLIYAPYRIVPIQGKYLPSYFFFQVKYAISYRCPLQVQDVIHLSFQFLKYPTFNISCTQDWPQSSINLVPKLVPFLERYYCSKQPQSEILNIKLG